MNVGVDGVTIVMEIHFCNMLFHKYISVIEKGGCKGCNPLRKRVLIKI